MSSLVIGCSIRTEEPRSNEPRAKVYACKTSEPGQREQVSDEPKRIIPVNQDGPALKVEILGRMQPKSHSLRAVISDCHRRKSAFRWTRRNTFCRYKVRDVARSS